MKKLILNIFHIHKYKFKDIIKYQAVKPNIENVLAHGLEVGYIKECRCGKTEKVFRKDFWTNSQYEQSKITNII